MLALLVTGMRDINVRNDDGLTSLDLAVRGENFLSAKYLMDHGATTTQREENGQPLSQLLEKQVRDWESSCGRGLRQPE